MIVNVVGIRRNFSFKTPDGNSISGSNLYVQHPQEGVEGLLTEKFFLNDKFDISVIKPPCEIEIFFNRYGKIDTFRLHKVN